MASEVIVALALGLLAIACYLMNHSNKKVQERMTDFAPIHVEVDAALAVMADAAGKIQEDVNTIMSYAAHVANPDEAAEAEVQAVAARLRAGTEALVGALASARAAVSVQAAS